MHFLQRRHGRNNKHLLQSWPQLWALVLSAPATLAITSMSATTAAAAIVVTFGLPTISAMAMTADSVRALRGQLLAAARFGACAAVTCLGFAGLFAFSVPLVAAAIAAYAMTATWARYSQIAARAQAAAGPQHPQERVAALPIVGTEEVRGMTDAELCQTWRRSSIALMSARSIEHRTGVVSLRQMLLDEMEVRHPAGLWTWLHSGARAADGPDKFFDRDDEGGTTQVA